MSRQTLRTKRSLEWDADSSTEDELSAFGRNLTSQMASPKPPISKQSAKSLTILSPSVQPRAVSVNETSARTQSRQTRIPMPHQLKHVFVPVNLTRPITPHTTRALKQRGAANVTTGGNKRKSGHLERETPRGTLRKLSRILAATSEPKALSPTLSRSVLTQPDNVNHDDELGEHLDLSKPSLTFPNVEEAGYETDEDFYMEPPSLSVPVDTSENQERSIEIARRTGSAQIGSQLSRDSFGSARLSGHFVDTRDLTTTTMIENIQSEGTRLSLPDGAGEDVGTARPAGSFLKSRDDTRDQRQETLLVPLRRFDHDRQEHKSDDDAYSEFSLDIPSSRFSPPPLAIAESVENHIWTMPATSNNCSVVQKRTSRKRMKPRSLNVSSHGVTYAPVSAVVIKRIASRFSRRPEKCKASLGKESIEAVTQATNWFFEQLGADLGAFAQHANRKKIDESDVTTIMRRQRHLKNTQTPFSMAQRYLPRELLQNLRLRSDQS